MQKFVFIDPSGDVTFLFPNKKVTKEVGIGEALREGALPYVPYPPHRHPTCKNVPIFAGLPRKNLTDFTDVSVQKSGHFERWLAGRRRGFLRGLAFS